VCVLWCGVAVADHHLKLGQQCWIIRNMRGRQECCEFQKDLGRGRTLLAHLYCEWAALPECVCSGVCAVAATHPVLETDSNVGLFRNHGSGRSAVRPQKDRQGKDAT
jgi:hypothetical protein